MKNSIKIVTTVFLLTGWPAILTNTIDLEIQCML